MGLYSGATLRSFCEGKRNQGFAPLLGHLHHGIAGFWRGFAALLFRLGLKTQGLGGARSDTQPAADTAVKVNLGHLLRPDSDGFHLTAIQAGLAGGTQIRIHQSVIIGYYNLCRPGMLFEGPKHATAIPEAGNRSR